MDLSRVILGPVVTEKAERLKASENGRTYTLRIAPGATKVDVRRSLERFYDISVRSVRIVKVRPKVRTFGAAKTMEKRHPGTRALVTLAKDSKSLDISAFETHHS